MAGTFPRAGDRKHRSLDYPRSIAERSPSRVKQPLTEPGAVRVRRALLSVSDKRGIVDFARGLAELGIELISTGGTARELEGDYALRDS